MESTVFAGDLFTNDGPAVPVGPPRLSALCSLCCHTARVQFTSPRNLTQLNFITFVFHCTRWCWILLTKFFFSIFDRLFRFFLNNCFSSLVLSCFRSVAEPCFQGCALRATSGKRPRGCVGWLRPLFASPSSFYQLFLFLHFFWFSYSSLSPGFYSPFLASHFRSSAFFCLPPRSLERLGCASVAPTSFAYFALFTFFNSFKVIHFFFLFHSI